MCKVIETEINGKRIHIADIKEKYIINIVNAAEKCSIIDRIMLFGSCIEERCNESSDIDLAIFGNQTEYKALRSKEYDRFTDQLYQFDDSGQSYDLLYFITDKTYHGKIVEDIQKGELIYAKN